MFKLIIARLIENIELVVVVILFLAAMAAPIVLRLLGVTFSVGTLGWGGD